MLYAQPLAQRTMALATANDDSNCNDDANCNDGDDVKSMEQRHNHQQYRNRWTQVIRGMVPAIVFMAIVASHAWRLYGIGSGTNTETSAAHEAEEYAMLITYTILWSAAGLIIIAMIKWGARAAQRGWRRYGRTKITLADFTTFQAPKQWTVPSEKFHKIMDAFQVKQEEKDFQLRLLARSGIDETTAFPPGIMADTPCIDFVMARAESETVMFTCIDELFSRTGVDPKKVDIVVTNCSLFNPTPSLSAMIMNQYKMRADVHAYSLGGQGCSASLLSIQLASDLLRLRTKDSIAIVMSFENITQNIYQGTDRSMLLQNTLFRCGGAAIMLTNYAFTPRPRLYRSPQRKVIHNGIDWTDCYDRSKASAAGPPISQNGEGQFVLEALVRCTLASEDDAYSCVYQTIDANGMKGVRLEKCLMDVAGRALSQALTMIGPKILPYSEQFRYAVSLLYRQMYKALKPVVPQFLPAKAPALYTPNFKTAADAFCIHAGGRAVIDAIQNGLNLTDDDVAASRSTLARYGNTSSSSIWYELLFNIEHCKLPPGKTALQMAFGSGFKSNLALWRRL